jgi:hypothetical protein
MELKQSPEAIASKLEPSQEDGFEERSSVQTEV